MNASDEFLPLTAHQFLEPECIKHAAARLYHNKVLNTITDVLLLLSLVGQILVCLTGCLFRKWWSSRANRITVQICIGFGLQTSFFMIADSSRFQLRNSACIAVRAILQYITVATFLWLLSLAVHIYRKIVIVFEHKTIKHFFIKSLIANWGLPVIPMLMCLVLSPQIYKLPGQEVCESTKRIILYNGVVAPMVMVVIANTVLYIKILITMWRKGNIRSTVKKSEMRQIICSVFFFFFMGLTWSFALIASIPELNKTIVGVICWYIFCSTAPMNGMVLFTFLILLNQRTRQMWVDWIKRKPQRSYSISNVNAVVNNIIIV